MVISDRLIVHAPVQSDVGLGVTMNGRDMPQLENVIGNFQNVACVRTDLAGCTTFLAVLDR